jgi:hypothetical protein
VPALEPVAGVRVVARPDALDGARWVGDEIEVLRIARDEAFGIGASGVEVDDEDALVEPETGFVTASLAPDDQLDVVEHLEWTLPDETGAIAQGKVAGVPVKLLHDDPMTLVVQAAYADELRRRLGW